MRHRPRTFRTTFIVAAVLTAGFAACETGDARPPQRVVIEADDYSFAPDRVEVQADQEIVVFVDNVGTQHHHWELRKDGTQVPGTLSHADPQMLEPRFVLEPGSYEMVCTIPGHEARGMVGLLIAR